MELISISLSVYDAPIAGPLREPISSLLTDDLGLYHTGVRISLIRTPIAFKIFHHKYFCLANFPKWPLTNSS